MVCPKCGNQIPDNSMFCPSCGNKFKKKRSILKIIGIVFAVLIVIVIIGSIAGGGSEQTSERTAVGTSTAQVGISTTEEPVIEEAGLQSGMTIDFDSYKITITDYRVIQPGEKGNEYGERPVIAFWYDTTNISSKDLNPMSAWIIGISAIQDNDPNKVNELSVGMLPDDTYLDDQMATIKEGGTLASAMSYELTDEETPVLLQAKKSIISDVFYEQLFELK